MIIEFVKSLHSNYESIKLDSQPDENRYQYCILSKGGIRGLLSCDLRNINGETFLYYDITSKQSIAQLFNKRKIDRKWVMDFADGIKELRRELERFLLNERNIIWSPSNIYQDLGKTTFSYVYVPYLNEGNGFKELLDFIVDKMDYHDEKLVETVYRIYEQYEENGEMYLANDIYEDVKTLEKSEELQSEINCENNDFEPLDSNDGEQQPLINEDNNIINTQKENGKFSLFGKRKKREQERRSKYQRELKLEMEGKLVAEEPVYEVNPGRTIYIPENKTESNCTKKLYSEEGKILAVLTDENCTIGKIAEEVDLVLNDISVSRIHARILRENQDYYLEDLNATNGTYKNGLRLKPYEKRKLQDEDEITLGEVTIIFR